MLPMESAFGICKTILTMSALKQSIICPSGAEEDTVV